MDAINFVQWKAVPTISEIAEKQFTMGKRDCKVEPERNEHQPSSRAMLTGNGFTKEQRR